jgi:hypothetical protein
MRGVLRRKPDDESFSVAWQETFSSNPLFQECNFYLLLSFAGVSLFTSIPTFLLAPASDSLFVLMSSQRIIISVDRNTMC